MFVESHDLEAEFPDYVELIAELRHSDARFQALFDKYTRCNSEVVKAEENDVPMSDFTFEDLKKRRLVLKDQLYGLLRAHAGRL